jgi:pimeloyl-ACP methyl ester carboxylesterase
MGATLAVRTVGSGPPLLLVHGGVGPTATWAAQEPLAARWQLSIPWRRGFGESPPTERQDFEDDAADLAALLVAGNRPHAVAFSYGGIGLLLAAGRAPGLVRSLTLIEPPLFDLAADHPDVAALVLLSNAYAGGSDDAVADFERFAGLGGAGAGELGGELDEARRLARGIRQPDEADPDLVAINAAGVPALVVSGGHHPGLEAVCDELAGRLAAHRERIEGAGHAAQRAPGFNDVLEAFLRSAEQAA